MRGFDKLASYSHENITVYDNHQKETKNVVEKIKRLHESNPDKKIAILTARRGKDIDLIMNELNQNSITYFNALELNTESIDYKSFCDECAKAFQSYFDSEKNIVKKELNKWYLNFKGNFRVASTQQQSLFTLLTAFLKDIVGDRSYRLLNREGKYNYILSVFLEHKLSKYLSAIENPIQVLTIHTKGIKWDIIFL